MPELTFDAGTILVVYLGCGWTPVQHKLSQPSGTRDTVPRLRVLVYISLFVACLQKVKLVSWGPPLTKLGALGFGQLVRHVGPE
jgi:hypothetical protein